jgi:tetratricopeptide (TPR) repeat protein
MRIPVFLFVALFVMQPPIIVSAQNSVEVKFTYYELQNKTIDYSIYKYGQKPDSTILKGVEDYIWEMFIFENTIIEYSNLLGIVVCPNELGELVFGDKVHPIIIHTFKNPETDYFDPLEVVKFLNYFNEMDGSVRRNWHFIESEVIVDRVSSKFFNLISKLSVIIQDIDSADYQLFTNYYSNSNIHQLPMSFKETLSIVDNRKYMKESSIIKPLYLSQFKYDTLMQNYLYINEYNFETDSFLLSINGSGNSFGFRKISETNTKQGNLSKLYTGLSYYQICEYDSALYYLINYVPEFALINSLITNLIGNIYFKKNNLDKAIYYFNKTSKSTNSYLKPLFLFNLGISYKKNNQLIMANECFNEIKQLNYSNPIIWSIEKYIE